jgi:4-amino-4-deoxy-L-arabinose transferase-like glycosyltransferase
MPAFTLAPREREKRPYYLAIFLAVFAALLFAIHLPLVGLPFFWDEQGQFIPTALDLLRHGAWIARSTIPNVHPPGVEAYLVVWYKLFGFSIELTRVAMLLLAALGVLVTFLLAIQLSRGTEGAPAFLPVVFLLASPLFYTQSMMAQLDMPAMVLTLLALLLFLQRKYGAAALASGALVLVKETGIVAPLVFFVVLAWQRDWKRAAYFIAPAAALGGWLCVLHHGTGYWLGNPGFAHYNVEYSLNPARMALSFARRLYYLFIAEFRWIGTALLVVATRRAAVFRSEGWRITFAVGAANIVLVSVFGGAELERYLLPVLPIFYIAVSVALTYVPRWQWATATAALAAGLVASLFWNPPYPFPYENNLAMVDFVRLQKTAAQFAERNFKGRTIATAWPYTAGLERPDYGFVDRKLTVIETNDFHLSSIEELPAWRFDVLITYTRTWAPEGGVVSIPMVRRFLSRFYEWQPDITTEQCAELGLRPVASWRLRGQEITIYARPGAVTGRAAKL